MKEMKLLSSLVAGLALALSGSAFAAVPISTSGGVFPLVTAGQAAPIFTAAGDHKVVGIAAGCLADDVEDVSGVKPQVSEAVPTGANVILIGTIGKSPVIDSLIAGGKLNVASIQGKWESFVIQTVDNPVAGVGKALVIAGSDRRGAAFGAFDISEGMGVSPWVWWADVVPVAKSELWIASARYEQGPPAVKYRGIFLNDEDWALQPWAAKTYEPEVGDVGPKTYAKICELLLRLRANYLWPAMHPSTRAFNHYPQNKIVADDYAIVMGASHAEPMLRNNVDEWDESVRGAYNYVTNRANVLQYWDERALANGAYDNIYTIGMRGIHDSPMEGGGTTAEKVTRLENIFADQRQILANRVNPDASKVPQVFVPYKEVLDLYKAGLRVPDDVTIMWPDDNHGYIRQLPTAQERARSGGSGIYYHISYWGTPYDYLWLCTTPPSLIWSEMSKAYDYGAQRMWVLNVGDIKPGELCTQFFMELARDPEKFRNFDQLAYLKDWAGKTFGAQFADSIGSILDRYYRLNHPIKPEHLNITSSGFSHVKNGDEAERRLQDFEALARDADVLESQIPAELRAAYFELVLYPVRGTNLMNRKVLLAERSRLFAQQKRKSTVATRNAAVQAYNQIGTETTYYNTSIAGGKWNWMMHWHPRDQSVFNMPTTGSYNPPADGPLGVSVEGSARTLDPGDSVALPPFSPAADGQRFIDVFGTGNATRSWNASASVPWITLSKTSGTTASDSRVLVGIDWSKAPRGFSVSSPVVISDGASADREILVTIYNPPGLQTSGAVERNGTVEIEAEKYDRTIDRGGIGWKLVKGLGASGDAVSPYPTQFEPFEVAALKTSAPSLEYDFYTFDKGTMSIQTASLPTYPIDAAHQIRFAIAVNDETPQIVVANAGTWDANVLRAAALSRTTHNIAVAGKQTLKLWAIDPTTVVDKFTITAPPSKAATTTSFEAENLAVSSRTANITYRTFDEAPASGGKATVLESSSNGQFLTLTVPYVQAGTYDVALRVKKLNSRGIVQMAVADAANGPFTNTGPTFDLYNSTDLYADVPAIRVTFATSGTKYLRFSVAGRNAAANNSWICLDAVSFNPVSLLKTPLTMNQWRENFFGSSDSTGLAADDADWDGDGDSNLKEYATGTYPTEVQNARSLAAEGDSVIFRFTREAAATGVLMSVDASDSLPGNWETIWNSQSLPAASGSLIQQLQAVDPRPLSESSRRFYRLRVDRIQ